MNETSTGTRLGWSVTAGNGNAGRGELPERMRTERTPGTENGTDFWNGFLERNQEWNEWK